MDSLAGNMITGFLLLVLLLAIVAPSYWLLKTLGFLDRPDGRKTTMREDLAELFPPAQASGATTARTAYRYFLCFAIVAVTGWFARQIGDRHTIVELAKAIRPAPHDRVAMRLEPAMIVLEQRA